MHVEQRKVLADIIEAIPDAFCEKFNDICVLQSSATVEFVNNAYANHGYEDRKVTEAPDEKHLTMNNLLACEYAILLLRESNINKEQENALQKVIDAIRFQYLNFRTQTRAFFEDLEATWLATLDSNAPPAEIHAVYASKRDAAYDMYISKNKDITSLDRTSSSETFAKDLVAWKLSLGVSISISINKKVKIPTYMALEYGVYLLENA